MIIHNHSSEHSETLKEIMGIICRNMMELNPKENVINRPYTKPAFVKRELAKHITIDLDKLFPSAHCGDYTYVNVLLLSQYDAMVAITLEGVEQICINGIWRNCNTAKNIISAALKKGYNDVIFKCRKTDSGFGMTYMVSYPCYTFLWTCDYILWVRDTSPLAEYKDEQGFSVTELVAKNTEKLPSTCRLVYPPALQDDHIVDFNKLYQTQTGQYAASYSRVKKAGVLELKAVAKHITIYVNRTQINTLTCQSQTESYGDAITIPVKADDEIMILSERNDTFWGFTCYSNELLHLPFVVSERTVGTHWIHTGLFDQNIPPAFSLTTPYENTEHKPVFWRFTDPNTYLRPYLDTSFFGQWFYGLMVAVNGLLNASKYNNDYYTYFEDHMRILVDYYKYMQYDAELFGDSTFLKRSVHTNDLDSIGTIGMNLYELYICQTDECFKAEIKYILEKLAESVYNNIPRLKDDTFCRVDVMWADDTYMSCPFLVRMGNLTGDTKYYDEVVKQLKSYTEKMFLEEDGIFAHIYYVYEKRNNHVPWGRGNGWVYLTFAEVLEHLPKDYAGRQELEEIFIRAVKGLVNHQAPNGMWHQVLNMESSYLETSCTAIFSMALAKAIKIGVLDKAEYLPVIQKAVNAIIRNYVDEFGNVHNICRGSGCCDDANYYAQLGTVLNDAHGTGVVVSAICGLIELLKENE